MIKIAGLSEEECAAIEAYALKHDELDLTKRREGAIVLSLVGEIYLDGIKQGLRSALGIGECAESVLRWAEQIPMHLLDDLLCTEVGTKLRPMVETVV